MLELIDRIRDRLAQKAYLNEAAVSHGVVTPILNALGWDSADPTQLVPEYSIERGRVDFALFGLGHKPAVFIEVKGVGSFADGDKQLFQYAFHQGVPLCVLTDGREWSFYLPSGHGSYDDRRVYRLQLDDRSPDECEAVLIRYLGRDRVRGGQAFEDAQRDHRDAAGKREAAAQLPRAWRALVQEGDDLLIDFVASKAEALCGFRPTPGDVLAFLRQSAGARGEYPLPLVDQPAKRQRRQSATDRTVRYSIFGEARTATTAAEALVDLLATLAKRYPAKIIELADAIRTPKRSLVARSPAEINPARPDLSRAAEIAPGWFVGMNTSNREKMGIIRTAVQTFDLQVPRDLDISLPNA